MKDFFQDIRAKLKAITSERDKIEQELEAMRQERDELMTVPLPLDEYLGKIDAAVDQAAEPYLNALRRHLIGFESDPFSKPPQPMNCFALASNDRAAIQSALFGLLGPQIKEAVRRLYANVEWEAGPPLAERQERLAALDKKIGEHEAALQRMTQEADAAGIRFGVVDPAPRPDLFRGGRPTDSAQAHRTEEMDRRRQGEKRGN